MGLSDDLERVQAELADARAERDRLDARIEGLVAHRDGLTRRLEATRRRTPAGQPDNGTPIKDMYKRPAIIAVLRGAERPLTATEITERLRDAGRTNEQVSTVQLYLTALFQDDMVVRPRRGVYELAPAKDPATKA